MISNASHSAPQQPAPIILASTSAYRRQLLERLGLPFAQQSPVCDERALESQHQGTPEQLVALLAQEKANSVAVQHPQSVVIGSDQCGAVDQQILGKPGTAERAVEQLALLSGRSHRLCTAVTLIWGDKQAHHIDVTTLHMRNLDRSALERYVERDQPLDCAGAYKLELAGVSLFERIESTDHSAITGLPLLWLTTTLASWGFALP